MFHEVEHFRVHIESERMEKKAAAPRGLSLPSLLRLALLSYFTAGLWSNLETVRNESTAVLHSRIRIAKRKLHL